MTCALPWAVAVCWVGCALSAAQASAPAPDVATRLKNSLASHPRLLLGAGEEKSINDRAAHDPRLGQLRDYVIAEADWMLTQPPLERKLTGRRLLSVSRAAVQRIGTLALAYRLTGEARFADGARECMKSVCAFSDFNPSHFLDVAEMTAALAVGYDWLFDVLPADEKAAVRNAILNKSLTLDVSKEGWVRGGNNWNQVCHGGLTMGALAIADEEPELAERVIRRAIENVPIAMRAYAPDGGFPEGASYWGYATRYSALLINSLESALGTDFELSQQSGFLASADYHLQVVGPSGRTFSYSDGNEKGELLSPAAFYLAKRRGDASLAFNDLAELDRQLAVKSAAKRSLPAAWLMLIWAGDLSAAPAPAATHFAARGITPVAVHRSGWTKSATFVGIKGGSPKSSHAHMDVGAFVLDAAGERWAGDLGAQEYNSLESKGVKLWNNEQGSQRWDVYRLGPMSHNILTVNGLPQVVAGIATIVKSNDSFTVVDTSPVYVGQLADARRGVMLRADGSVRVQDDLVATSDGLAKPPSKQSPTTSSTTIRSTTQASRLPTRRPAPAVVRWAMLTGADVTTDGVAATLTKNGKTLRMRIVSPEGAAVKVVSTVPPNDYDVANPGTRLVTFEVALEPGEKKSLAVDFVPVGVSADALPVTPLASW